MALFDLSSSWVEGSHCELAAFGHSRDGKRGKPQIEYGLLTDQQGRPVAVRVLAGNTGDPKAFVQAVEAVRDKLGTTGAVMVGDRGMITSARIRALKEIPGMAWLTCLRAPAIKKLAEDGGPLQLSLSGAQDLAEISSPDYPGERLIACHNPFLAAERAAHREWLLAATEAELAKIAAMAEAGQRGPGHAELQQHLRQPRQSQALPDQLPDRHRLQRLCLQAREGPLARGAEQQPLQGLTGVQPVLRAVTGGRRRADSPASAPLAAARKAPRRS